MVTDYLQTVDWSRAQFALTAIYHWLFVPLTLGLSVLCALMETAYYRTKDPFWRRTTKFWMRLFGVNFAIGVATGPVSYTHLVQPLRVRLQVPNGSVPLGCIRPFLAVAARPCRLFARQPGGFVVPCGSDLRLPDRRVTGCQGCRSAGTNPDAKIAKKFYRTFPPEHSRPGISVRASCPSIPVRVSLSARSCPCLLYTSFRFGTSTIKR